MQRLLLPLFIFVSILGKATEDEVKLKTSISEVTVYQQNALIHREGKVNVPAGNSAIILYDLNRSIRPQDVRINAKGDFTVLSISHRYDHDTISGKDGQKQRDEITKQIQRLQTQIQRENGFLDIYNKEEQMLLANQNFTHKEEGVDIDRLAKASDFIRNRFFDIKQKRLEIQDLAAELQQEIYDLQTKQNKIEGLKVVTTLEMIVRVNAKTQIRGEFTIDYRVYSAGWNPSYDAVVEKVSDPLSLEYKAKVYQNTGEDWDNVELTIATGNPNVNKKKPNLLPWYVSGQRPQNKPLNQQNHDWNAYLRSQPYNPNVRMVSGQLMDQNGEPIPYANVMIYGTTTGTTTDINGYYSLEIPSNGQRLQYSFIGYNNEILYISNPTMNVIMKSQEVLLGEVNVLSQTVERTNSSSQFGIGYDGYAEFDSGGRDRKDVDFFANSNTDFAQVSVAYSPINTKFKIDAIYTIPSDGMEYAVQIQKHEMDANYIYQCSPKLDATAYLTAQITDWEEFNLLSGPMNIYFEDAFIGASQLDLSNAEDTLSLSLGEDKNIFIERRRVKSENKKQTLGSHKKVIREFEIVVRNNKRENVTIIIEDQVPITTTEDIEIEAETLSGGKLDELTGKVKWELNMNSGKKKTLNFKYTVKYPKNMYLNV